jgi:hypothetical protein
MSLKPPKKSDMGKTWMQRGKKKEILIQPQYHLIVSEGTKTEPQYFDGIKRKIINRYGNDRIHIETTGTGRNTLSLLDYAQKLVRENNNPIRHVWLVYDQDSFPADNFDNTAFKCDELTKSNNGNYPDDFISYHALWSNQCIEIWFLLHFEYYQSDIYRDEYIPKLSAYLNKESCGDYKKNRDDIYGVLRNRLSIAVKNAESLIKHHSNPAPSKNAPGTNIYKMFNTFAGYIN